MRRQLFTVFFGFDEKVGRNLVDLLVASKRELGDLFSYVDLYYCRQSPPWGINT
jgi:hypothetical protein